ncbi:MAG: hypothetical protein KDI79_31785 [Anaerolineae bacterium]|nr:hypothetical protein [Anaerolineae bacterium]
MHRLQISLTDEHYEFLKSEAFMANSSMAAVLRDLLDDIIEARRRDLLQNDPIWTVIGVGQDIEGPTDISSSVDKYLYGERESAPDSLFKQIAEPPDEYTAD